MILPRTLELTTAKLPRHADLHVPLGVNAETKKYAVHLVLEELQQNTCLKGGRKQSSWYVRFPLLADGNHPDVRFSSYRAREHRADYDTCRRGHSRRTSHTSTLCRKLLSVVCVRAVILRKIDIGSHQYLASVAGDSVFWRCSLRVLGYLT